MADRRSALRTIRSGSARMVVSNLLSQALNFLSGLLIARQLGAAGRGQVALVGVYDEVSSGAFSLGLPLAAGYEAKTGAQSLEQLLGAALKVSIYTVPMTAIAGFLVARFVFPNEPSLQIAVFTAISATPFVNTFLVTARMLLVARGSLGAVALLVPVQMVARLIALLMLAWTGNFTPGRAAMVVVLSVWMGNLLGWKLLGLRPRGGGRCLPLLGYGLKAVPGSLAHLATSRLDQILVAPLLGVRELGLYSVAIGVTFLPTNVGGALSVGVFSNVTGWNDPGMRQQVSRAVIGVAVAGAATALGAAFLLKPVYGNEFDGAVLPALILVPSAVAAGWFLVVSGLSHALGRPAISSHGQVAGLASTLVGLLVVLPSGGVVGAAAVASVAACVRLGVGCWLLRRAARSATPEPFEITPQQ